jgi:hypothetical protein
MRKPTILATSVVLGVTAMSGVLSSPAGAAERHPVARYNFTMAWPAVDGATPMTAIALAESSGDPARAGNIEFEWKVEEGEP